MSAGASVLPPPFPSSHAFEQDIPPSIADGVAKLLALDRQIIVVTGGRDGRMSGFLADLSHGISRGATLLRVKSPLTADEFLAALAGQLALPMAGATPAQLSARIGQRLRAPAPRGRFVLLCERADQYPLPTLEAIRQLSNHPVSIVLAGSPVLRRRLRRRALLPLQQRITHQLALNRPLPTPSFWLTLFLLLGGGGALLLGLLGDPQIAEHVPPRPISAPPPPASVDVNPSPPLRSALDTGVQLRLERELGHPPRRSPQGRP